MKKESRHEFKYVVDRHLLPIISGYLEAIGLKKDEATNDEYAIKNGSYIITSLYFDTPSLKDHYDKLSGLKHRRKLRARIYTEKFFDDEEKVWLEVKEKFDTNILKHRSSVSKNIFLKFSKTGNVFSLVNQFNLQKALDDFKYLCLWYGYGPHIIVRYNRKAYIGYFMSNFRLTLDSNIEACRWRDVETIRHMTPVFKDKFVIEAKFRGAMPWWFKDMIRRFQLSRSSFSKYTNSVDALHRHNKIAR